MPGFVNALRVKWPRVRAREDFTVLATLGDSADPDNPVTAVGQITPRFDFTGWSNFKGAVAAKEGTTTAVPAAFDIEVRIYGAAVNGQLLVKMSRHVTGGLQDRAIPRGSIDIFGLNDATQERKKFLEGIWSLDLSTTQEFS